MSARLAKGERMTVEQYLDWSQEQPKGRYELVDGLPFEMSPERNAHAMVKGAVYLVLREAIRASGSSLVAFVDGPTIATGKLQAREPDVVVHAREGIDWDSMRLDRPIVLVEVTSPSTWRTDSGDKLVEYFSISSLGHYLIVDPHGRDVVHHRRGVTGVVESATVTSGSIILDPPGLRLDIDRFFEDLPPRGAH